MCSDDPRDREALSSYVANYRAFLLLERTPLGKPLFPSFPPLSSYFFFVDVLEDFKSVQPFKDHHKTGENLAVFLGLMGPLRPRYTTSTSHHQKMFANFSFLSFSISPSLSLLLFLSLFHRYYSIASSPDAEPNHLRIVYKVFSSLPSLFHFFCFPSSSLLFSFLLPSCPLFFF